MERINFVIGSNGNIGKSLVNYETNLKNNVIGIDKSNKIHKSNKFYSHWNLDCTQPKILEAKLNDYYKKKKFKINNLVLCAVLDSVPMFDLKTENYQCGLQKQSFEEIQKRISVNVTSQIFMLKVFEPYLYEESSVCLFSSIYGLRSPDHNIYEGDFIKPLEYSASKSSILGITKHFAITSAMKGIGRCNCIVLGGLESDEQSENFKKNYTDKVPLKRMANIKDVLHAYKYISSPDASYVTGTSLIVDGGYTCW